jgi:hypothetical protein
MKSVIIILLIFASALSFGQIKKVAGTYSSTIPKFEVTLNGDSTFQYVTTELHPVFYRWESFSEKGKWALAGDTIILNPNLPEKIFVEYDFKEDEDKGDTNLFLTFNHIKRYFDSYGNIVKNDTLQIEQLDYWFNEYRKKKVVRITPRRTTRCAFAGYIPKEIITTSHIVSIPKPREVIDNIFIGCYELQGTKEFKIKNANSNHFTLNVYSNYYMDGQIRRMKFLIKNENVLYTKRKKNGEFEKDNIWTEADAKIKREKGGS